MIKTTGNSNNTVGNKRMSQAAAFAAGGGAKSHIETSTIRAISWRLIPFLVLAYFFSYLGRVNLGFAALTMNAELKFTPLMFAWGAGIFLIGYFIFEVPSNLALEKFGACRWIARIMVSWGIISALMATVSGEVSFYVLRFLLGVAEAGFFPGIGRISRALHGRVCDCRSHFHGDRGADLGPPARARWRLGPQRLASGSSSSKARRQSCSASSAGSISPTSRSTRAGLSRRETAWLVSRLNAERAAKEAARHFTLGEALASSKVITPSLIYFGFVGAPFFLTAIALAVASYLTEADAHHGGAELGRDRHLLHLRGVLDPADRVAVRHGRRRRDRADQFDRKSRGLRWPVPDRLGQGSDRFDLTRTAPAGCAAVDRRASRRPRRA
jgi:hypothetical protein